MSGCNHERMHVQPLWRTCATLLCAGVRGRAVVVPACLRALTWVFCAKNCCLSNLNIDFLSCYIDNIAVRLCGRSAVQVQKPPPKAVFATHKLPATDIYTKHLECHWPQSNRQKQCQAIQQPQSTFG